MQLYQRIWREVLPARYIYTNWFHITMTMSSFMMFHIVWLSLTCMFPDSLKPFTLGEIVRSKFCYTTWNISELNEPQGSLNPFQDTCLFSIPSENIKKTRGFRKRLMAWNGLVIYRLYKVVRQQFGPKFVYDIDIWDKGMKVWF